MSAKSNEPKTVNLPGRPFPVAVISAIIERQHDGQSEILLQTRWKPDQDPKYSGALEIPAGTLALHEDVYQAVRREVFEETGLRVVAFRPDVRTRVRRQHGDDSFAFLPFCCQQQTVELSRVGFVFLCTVEPGEPRAAPGETRSPHWVSKAALRALLAEQPEAFFTFQLGALEYYLEYDE